MNPDEEYYGKKASNKSKKGKSVNDKQGGKSAYYFVTSTNIRTGIHLLNPLTT